MSLRPLWLAVVPLAALAGCTTPAPASPSPQPSVISSPAPIDTLAPAPSASPSATLNQPTLTADSSLLAWPTYAAPTLAPFPLDLAGSPATQPAEFGFPPIQAPLALNPNDHFYFSFPVANSHLGLYSPSQRYGVRQEASPGREPHLGLDVGMDAGTPVRAAAEGTVVWASYGQTYNSPYFLDDPYGISIVIRHDFGYAGNRLWTIYAHLREVSVQVGQRVQRGEVIAMSGNTGLSTGPHLHFEVRSGVNNTYNTYNPELWLAPPEGHGVLVGRVANERNQLILNRLVEVRSLQTEQLWSTYSYFTANRVQSDPYYKENMVLANLPAGRYEVAIPHRSIWWRVEVEVLPGAVTYFQFMGNEGYQFELPAEPPLVGVPE